MGATGKKFDKEAKRKPKIWARDPDGLARMLDNVARFLQWPECPGCGMWLHREIAGPGKGANAGRAFFWCANRACAKKEFKREDEMAAGNRPRGT